jgi:protein-S-isoprenylcysteine O-methyltransferase Ste14
VTAESTFRMAFWVLLAGVLAMRVCFSLRVRRAGERVMPDREAIAREGRGVFAIRVAAFFSLLAFLVLYALDVPWMDLLSIPFPTWIRWGGFALGLGTLVFWTWTQSELDKEWSPQLQLRQEHRLVTTGPYARIRHPIYAATMSIGIAFALVTANWVFVLLATLSAGMLVVRVLREEQMMIEKFGDKYRVYMQETGRFVPPIDKFTENEYY